MNWQGIPFLFDFPAFETYGILNINKIPNIIVDSGFAWDSVIGGFIAGAIPGLIAWYTIRENLKALQRDRHFQQKSFDDDRNAQLNIATKNLNAQVLSANRQAWINNLRDTIAEYISYSERLIEKSDDVEISLKALKVFENVTQEQYAASKELLSGLDKYTKNAKDANDSYNQLKQKMIALKSKVSLLLNPEDELYSKIIELMNNIYYVGRLSAIKASESGSNPYMEMDKIITELTKVVQVCLKKEWIRVKAGT